MSARISARPHGFFVVYSRDCLIAGAHSSHGVARRAEIEASAALARFVGYQGTAIETADYGLQGPISIRDLNVAAARIALDGG